MSIQNEDLINAVKKHPLSFGFGLVAIALGALGYFRSSSAEELEKQLARQSSEGQKLELNIRNSVQLREQLEALETALAVISNRAVDPLALATNLQHFYELEAALNVKLIDLRQGSTAKTTSNSEYPAVSYNVAIEGSFEQVLQFLKELEHGRHFVRFNSVNLAARRETRSTGAEIEPTITLNMTVDLLGKPQP
jgi:hypothetical protein